MATAKKTDPALWDRVKNEITQGDRGGKPGQWSARKAQLAVREYKMRGGGYQGGKDADNHLRRWTDEQWGTKSGAESGKTGERYLPKRAREHLTKQEYAGTTAKKRNDSRKGKQFSAQPPAIARKIAEDRAGVHTGTIDTPIQASTPVGQKQAPAQLTSSPKRVNLMARAAQLGIAGRSRMSKAQLMKVLGQVADELGS